MTAQLLGLLTPKEILFFSYIIDNHTLNLDHIINRHARCLAELMPSEKVQKCESRGRNRRYSVKQMTSVVLRKLNPLEIIYLQRESLFLLKNCGPPHAVS